MPFLVHNHIVIDHADRTVIDKMLGFNLLHPHPLLMVHKLQIKLKDIFTKVMATCKLVAAELKLAHLLYCQCDEKVRSINVITTVQRTI